MNSPPAWSDWFTAFDDLDLWGGLLILGVIAAVILIVIPILLFGLKLIIVGVLLAGTSWARLVMRKPWTVGARALDQSGRIVRWRVVGWRRSVRLIDQLRRDLAAGREPVPESDVPPDIPGVMQRPRAVRRLAIASPPSPRRP